MQNPEIFSNDHYKQALLAVVAGIAIRLIIAIPVGSFICLGFSDNDAHRD